MQNLNVFSSEKSVTQLWLKQYPVDTTRVVLDSNFFLEQRDWTLTHVTIQVTQLWFASRHLLNSDSTQLSQSRVKFDSRLMTSSTNPSPKVFATGGGGPFESLVVCCLLTTVTWSACMAWSQTFSLQAKSGAHPGFWLKGGGIRKIDSTVTQMASRVRKINSHSKLIYLMLHGFDSTLTRHIWVKNEFKKHDFKNPKSSVTLTQETLKHPFPRCLCLCLGPYY